jgi:hypothetical protein
MCNPAFNDGVRKKVSILISHTDELRLKYADVEERYRLGNLGDESLGDLNQAIHQLETDIAGFESLIEEHG